MSASVTDQLADQNTCLIIKGGKLTAEAMAAAMRRALLEKNLKGSKGNVEYLLDKQKEQLSVKEILKQDGEGSKHLKQIEIHRETLGDFEKVAKKHGVDVAIVKDENKDQHTVFFKARDEGSVTDMFKDYIKAVVQEKNQEKAPVKRRIRKLKEKVMNQPKHREKTKTRGRER